MEAPRDLYPSYSSRYGPFLMAELSSTGRLVKYINKQETKSWYQLYFAQTPPGSCYW